MEKKQVAGFSYHPKWQTAVYITPAKMIIQFEDVATFKKTKIYQELVQFLVELQKVGVAAIQSIRSKPISHTKPIDKFKIFQKFFGRLGELLEETPPIQQPMRFGNKALKDWLAKVDFYARTFLEQFIPEPIAKCREELHRYIIEAFGNNTRIDYGTGHELSFMFFCWGLYRLGYYSPNEFEQMVRQVFYQYINLMRKVQVKYNLQPAGSHGVWGIDDYHFLPFLLGASELINNDVMTTPDAIHNVRKKLWQESQVNQFYKDYMYMNCIKFIKEVKKGVPFSESSPILDNISGAATWEKVTNGLVKMYEDQVLGKHPVIKHAYFGTIVPYQ